MLIFAPSSEDCGFDHDYPRGMTLTLLVVMALSTATAAGVLVCLWRLL